MQIYLPVIADNTNKINVIFRAGQTLMHDTNETQLTPNQVVAKLLAFLRKNYPKEGPCNMCRKGLLPALGRVC